MTEGSPPAATDGDSERSSADPGDRDDDTAQHASADVAPELFGW